MAALAATPPDLLGRRIGDLVRPQHAVPLRMPLGGQCSAALREAPPHLWNDPAPASAAASTLRAPRASPRPTRHGGVPLMRALAAQPPRPTVRPAQYPAREALPVSRRMPLRGDRGRHRGQIVESSQHPLVRAERACLALRAKLDSRQPLVPALTEPPCLEVATRPNSERRPLPIARCMPLVHQVRSQVPKGATGWGMLAGHSSGIGRCDNGPHPHSATGDRSAYLTGCRRKG